MYKTSYREALFELDINLVDIEKKKEAITWITRYREALNKLKKKKKKTITSVTRYR